MVCPSEAQVKPPGVWNRGCPSDSTGAFGVGCQTPVTRCWAGLEAQGGWTSVSPSGPTARVGYLSQV